MHSYITDGAEIYRRSFAMIRAEADLARFSPEEEIVAVRMIHAAGMVGLEQYIQFSDGMAIAARAALEAGAPIFCDARMVSEGVTRGRLPADNEVICTLHDASVPALAKEMSNTRSAAALELWRPKLAGSVVAIGNAPDGENINEGVGALHPQLLAATIQATGADLGIALDGDADRLVMVDTQGKAYDGDQILYAIVRERLLNGPVAGVVGTLMTNMALEQALAEHQVPFKRAKVGDRYVMELLAAEGWLFGGENSGHILALDRHTTGDGMVSALQVLVALKRAGGTLAELLGALVLYPQCMINVPVKPGFNWQDHKTVVEAVNASIARLGNRGRVLLRPSGTEPVLRVMVEAIDAELSRNEAAAIAAVVQAAL